MKTLEQKIYFTVIIIYLLLATILVIADLTNHLSQTLLRTVGGLYLIITVSYLIYYLNIKRHK